MPDSPTHAPHGGLPRTMGLLGLVATGVAAMVGAGIHVIPFMIHRNVPGIGPYVLPAFLCAAIPAIFAGLSYAILASAMPRAGGSYVYASRGLHPYVGFIASFSQWFALCIAMGVVSYVLVPFLRDTAAAAHWPSAARLLEGGASRVGIPLALVWFFAAVNVRGVKSYERILVPLVGLTFALGGIVIVTGFWFSQENFAAAVAMTDGSVPAPPPSPWSWRTLFTAASVLFASFIGFDSIAQAGGEAKNPSRNLPLAIGLSVGLAGTFYMLFTAAVYHAVPWQYVAREAVARDLTAPGLLAPLLPAGMTAAIIAGAAVALAKDVPPMLLGVSRLMFAWADDGIFPAAVAHLHPRWRTPDVAILASAAMASVGILGCHLAGDFFLGVDIMVTAMLVNFVLMCLTVLILPLRNPTLAQGIRVLPHRGSQIAVALAGVASLGFFLVVHTVKDLTAPVSAWYFRSTPVWLLVMAVATVIYLREVAALRRQGVDVQGRFATLPPE